MTTRAHLIRLPADLDLGPNPSARVRAALQVADPNRLAQVEAKIVAEQVVGRPPGSRSRTPIRRVRCPVCGRETAGTGADGMTVRRHSRYDSDTWCPGGAQIGIVT